MRIELVQFAPQFPGRAENWDRIRSWAERLDADVVVFPELTSCGYCYENRQEIRGYTDPRSSLGPLEEIARRRHRLIVGGFAEESEGRLYNSAYVVSPEGTRVYRKIHLWNKEKVIFDEGVEPLVVEFQGHRLGLEVCYDLQFPELASYYSQQGAEVILVPTAWAEEEVGPVSGLQSYSHLAIATAYSHGLFVVVANRVGVERGARFPGESSVCDPFGRIHHLGDAEGTLATVVDFALIPQAKRPNERNDLDRDARLGLTLPSTARRGVPTS